MHLRAAYAYNRSWLSIGMATFQNLVDHSGRGSGDGVPHVAGSWGRATCWRGEGEVRETDSLGR